MAGGAVETGGANENVIGGVSVGDLQEAKGDFAFTPFAPQGLGDPTSIWETDPAVPRVETRAIEFDYLKSPYGQVRVIESYPQFPIQSWPKTVDSIIATNGEADTHGHAESVTIRDGLLALLTVSEDKASSTVEWYESGSMEVTVSGPELGPDSSVKIANTI